MYAPTISPYKTSNHSPYRALEAEPRSLERENSPLQRQASDLLTCTSSRQAFTAGKAENGSEGLQKVAVSGAEKSGAITETQTVNVKDSTQAIKGMNCDLDQVQQMMELSPSAELFSALKDRSSEQALNFAEQNPEFQCQALHDMDDPAFQQDMRLRLTGQA